MGKKKIVPVEVAPVKVAAVEVAAVEVAVVENLTPLDEIMAYLNGRKLKNFEEMKNLCSHFGYKEGVWNLQAHFIMLRANGQDFMPYELTQKPQTN